MKTKLSSKRNTKHTKQTKTKLSIKTSAKQNGLKLYKNAQDTRLLVMPHRNEFAAASIYFSFKVGSKNETQEIMGISHFIEHMIFKGSKKYPNYLDISKIFDANGISFNAYTSKEITAYHYKFLSSSENLDIICKITSDMIFNPLMRDKDIKPERNVIIQEMKNDIDDVDEIINEQIEHYIFKGHTLENSIIGNTKTLNHISKKHLFEYHTKYYRPDNLVISFSGKMHHNYINIITKYFNGTFIPTSLDNKYNTIQIIPYIDEQLEPIIHCVPKKLEQDYIHIIFKTKGYFDPLLLQYKLLSNILAGNMSSQLFIEIREKLGYVYSIKCDITNYEEVGYFDIYTQNESDKTIKCINEIFNQLVKIKKQGVTEKELLDNKKNYCDVFKTQFDNVEYENEFYNKQLLCNKPLETMTQRITKINQITLQNIQHTAIDLFNFNKVNVIAFGKAEQKKINSLIKGFL
jgi:predicted Zn-dependent peptidase